jgi:hypothetical protein
MVNIPGLALDPGVGDAPVLHLPLPNSIDFFKESHGIVAEVKTLVPIGLPKTR